MILDELVEKLDLELKDGLGSCDLENVQQLLSDYSCSNTDWRGESFNSEFALFDPHRYTRNLVSSGNGKYNLMILCWGPEMKSPIHDHTNAHCLVKVLAGNLTETLYTWPENGSLTLKGETTFPADAVTYMHGYFGLI